MIIIHNYIFNFDASSLRFLSQGSPLVVSLCLGLLLVSVITLLSDPLIDSNINSASAMQNQEQEESRRKSIIDLQYVVFPRGVLMRDHNANQINTPNRQSNFIFNKNDPTGVSILNMLQGTNATLATVVINGQFFTGYEISMLPSGNLINSKLIRVNLLWSSQAVNNNDIWTVNTPILAATSSDRWSILTTNPQISSVQDNRGRDARHSLSYIT